MGFSVGAGVAVGAGDSVGAGDGSAAAAGAGWVRMPMPASATKDARLMTLRPLLKPKMLLSARTRRNDRRGDGTAPSSREERWERGRPPEGERARDDRRDVERSAGNLPDRRYEAENPCR